LLKISAEHGSSISQYNLGRIYENGNGVDKNVFESFKWYKLAADQGHKEAKERIKRAPTLSGLA
jgi:TPR repeat protein